MRKIYRNITATVCLLVGIAGLFLPFIQGIAMIVLAAVIADFAAKERLLERYRHTRVGSHLWHRHVARKNKDAERDGLVPESGPAPPASGESASDED
jgi:uncharacterized membrane protein YbaN (DUF454 family)